MGTGKDWISRDQSMKWRAPPQSWMHDPRAGFRVLPADVFQGLQHCLGNAGDDLVPQPSVELAAVMANRVVDRGPRVRPAESELL